MSKKLKDLLPDFPTGPSLQTTIEQKCGILISKLCNLRESMKQSAQVYCQLEAAAKFLNEEFDQLENRNIDDLLRVIDQPNLVTNMMGDYMHLKQQIELSLDSYLEVFSPKVSHFVPMPPAYSKHTTMIISEASAKHTDGYPAFVMTNALVTEGSTLRFVMQAIQDKYVGVALGLIEKTSVDSHGLILNFEQFQKLGHGAYLNFNDRCIYHSTDIELNGAEQGKDKGLSFGVGDVVSMEYSNGVLKYECGDQQYSLHVGDAEMYFVVWLDLSEVHLI